MKYRYAFIAFFVAFFLQTTFLNLVDFFGCTPNLLLCLVVLSAFLYEGNYSGIVLGVLFGLLLDLCYGQYVGVSALGYLLLGMAVLFTREILNKENFVTILIVTAIGTVMYNIFYWVMYYFLGSPHTFLYMIKIQPISIVYNMVVISIAYFAVIGKVTKHRKDRYYR